MKETIMNRMQEHWNAVAEEHDIVFLGLYGSQNYGLAHEDSDIDTKAIILPTVEDILLGRKPVSEVITMENGEKIDVKDIRVMFECFLKQNINFLEILFTEYQLMTDNFRNLAADLFNYKESVANYDNYRLVKCLTGMTYERYKAIGRTKKGDDGKYAHHVLRMKAFLKNYLRGGLFEDSLTPTFDTEELVALKKGEYTFSVTLEKASQALESVEQMKNTFVARHPHQINEEVKGMLNNIVMTVLLDKIKTEREE